MLALEVIALPVIDVDAAIAFYVEKLGFSLDVDYRPAADFRVVQLTPPGSACSIHLEPAGDAARLRGVHLVTNDLQGACDQLRARGVTVGEIRHKHPYATWSGGFAPGVDSEHRDYCSFADVTDPDGNRWTLQERGFHRR